MRHRWCSAVAEDGLGPNWEASWGTIGDYSSNGETPLTACCGCGGGGGTAEDAAIQAEWTSTSRYAISHQSPLLMNTALPAVRRAKPAQHADSFTPPRLPRPCTSTDCKLLCLHAPDLKFINVNYLIIDINKHNRGTWHGEPRPQCCIR